MQQTTKASTLKRQASQSQSIGLIMTRGNRIGYSVFLCVAIDMQGIGSETIINEKGRE